MTVDRVLRPNSVAVVGASDNVDKIGGRPIHFMRQYGFPGSILPVNPTRQAVQGLAAYPRVDALPMTPDVAILAVPADLVEEAVAQCADFGVGAAVVFSSGFAELGEDGRRRQCALVARARAAGMRLVGPNTIGIADFSRGAVLSFASGLLDVPPADGPVAILSQSGAFGVAAHALLRERDFGVRYMCATGNQADLDTAEFLMEVARDPQVTLALLYLEHVPDADGLAKAAAAAANAGIRMVAVAPGQSAPGRRSAEFHTGGERDRGVTPGFLRSIGISVAADLQEMTQAAEALLTARPRLSSRPRLALISNSGASCVIAADAAIDFGLDIAGLGGATVARLRQTLPPFSLNSNPIDLTAMLLTQPALFGTVLEIVLADPEVDAATVGFLAMGGGGYDVGAFARAGAEISLRFGKPLIAYAPSPRIRAAFRSAALPSFESERQALAFIRDLAATSADVTRIPA